MSLLDEIQSHSARKGPACMMGEIEKGLSAKDRTELEQAFADSSIPHTAIGRALKGRGHAVSIDTVSRHRKGDCACGQA